MQSSPLTALFLLATALLATASGCGEEATTTAAGTTTATSGTTGTTGTTGSGGSGGAGTGGAGGSGPVCPPGAHPTEAGACEAALTGWAAGPPIKHKRDHHVTFVTETPSGNFLYVAAGAGSSSATLAIERAAIAEDGTLGAFSDVAQLPTGIIGPGLAQLDRAFVLGGGLGSDSNSSAATYVGKIADDGAVTLTKGPDLGASRYHVSLVYVKGFVFALGGLFQQVTGGNVKQDVVDTVERAGFDGTTLSAFTMMPPLPTKLTHHATFVHDGAIYVLGGGSNLAAVPDILRASVSDTGDLGAWETVGQLSEGRASPAVTVFLDQLYVIGGMTSLTGGEQSTVLGGALDATGMLGSFSPLAPLPKARAHSHQAPLYHGHLYSVGGSINHVPQAQVYVGSFQ
ncbi:MAG: hypothetical protein ABI193_06835 [Minicystis sp.]